MVTAAADEAKTANVGSIYVRLTPVSERTRGQFTVIDDVRARIMPEFKDLNLRPMVQAVNDFGGGGRQSAEIQFVITGPDLNVLEQAGNKVAAASRQQKSLVDVDTSLNLGKPEVAVSIDRLKAADLGVEVADAANALRLLVGGDEVTTFNEGGEQYDVHLRARQDDRTTPPAIAQMTVPSSTARFGGARQPGEARSAARRRRRSTASNRQRQVTIYSNLAQGQSQTVGMAAMMKTFGELGLGPAIRRGLPAGRASWDGRATNFLLAFGLSFIFMYLILAAQFESWLHPVTILLSLPLTVPFAFISIILTGQSLNIFSMLGLLVLFGIVKKNSILQIDHALQLRAAGLGPKEAVLQASRDRLRPILMTTMAFVAGMLPLVWSSGTGAGTNRAIGFVVIGGQTLVLFLTLIVTPVAYSLFDDASNLKPLSRLRTRFVPARAAATTAGALLLAMFLGAASDSFAHGQARQRPVPVQPPPPIGCPPQPAPPPPPAPAPEPSAPGRLNLLPTPPVSGDALKLTLDDAVRRAIDNNPDLLILRLEPGAAEARVDQAKSAFVPVAAGIGGYNDTTSPPANAFLGADGVETSDLFSTVGVRQRLQYGGGAWNVSWDAAREGTNSPISSFDPALTSAIQLAFSQPLLRDRAIDNARFQLVITKRNREISDLQFQQALSQTTFGVKQAYWALKAANFNVVVQERSLELASELARQNRARVDVGTAPPLDLVQAEAEVAQRRENVIRARALAGDLEDVLRRLIMAPVRRVVLASAARPGGRARRRWSEARSRSGHRQRVEGSPRCPDVAPAGRECRDDDQVLREPAAA